MALVVKNLLASAGDIKRCMCDPWAGKIPWRRALQTILAILTGESDRHRSLSGYSLQGHTDSDMNEVASHAHTKGFKQGFDMFAFAF